MLLKVWYTALCKKKFWLTTKTLGYTRLWHVLSLSISVTQWLGNALRPHKPDTKQTLILFQIKIIVTYDFLDFRFNDLLFQSKWHTIKKYKLSSSMIFLGECETKLVIAGLLFEFTIVKLRGPNKSLTSKNLDWY